ncbi:hypothetical protein PFISCL1PPCAC_22904, partial [Pristionchus fissidentatus]
CLKECKAMRLRATISAVALLQLLAARAARVDSGDFGSVINQVTKGNRLEQCPCVRPPEGGACISYDSRYQASHVEEAMISFVDLTLPDRERPTDADSLSCASAECRACFSLLFYRIVEIGLLPASYRTAIPVVPKGSLDPSLCPRMRFPAAGDFGAAATAALGTPSAAIAGLIERGARFERAAQAAQAASEAISRQKDREQQQSNGSNGHGGGGGHRPHNNRDKNKNQNRPSHNNNSNQQQQVSPAQQMGQGRSGTPAPARQVTVQQQLRVQQQQQQQIQQQQRMQQLQQQQAQQQQFQQQVQQQQQVQWNQQQFAQQQQQFNPQFNNQFSPQQLLQAAGHLNTIAETISLATQPNRWPQPPAPQFPNPGNPGPGGPTNPTRPPGGEHTSGSSEEYHEHHHHHHKPHHRFGFGNNNGVPTGMVPQQPQLPFTNAGLGAGAQ